MAARMKMTKEVTLGAAHLQGQSYQFPYLYPFPATLIPLFITHATIITSLFLDICLDNHLVGLHILLEWLGHWHSGRSGEPDPLRPFRTWYKSQVLRCHANTLHLGQRCSYNVRYTATKLH